MKRYVVLLVVIGVAAAAAASTASAIDPPQFVLQWGTSGTGPGQFNRPSGVGVDASGNVYVADVNNARIQKFTGDGTYLLEWGAPGTGPGQFDYPRSPIPDAWGNVFVSDQHNHRIQKFTSEGAYILEWGSPGGADGQFYNPNGLLVDAGGFVCVPSGYPYSSERVQKFTGDGTFVLKWGSSGSGDGQFYNASGLAADSDGNVYVADFRNNRIQKFTSDGTFIRKWGTSGSGNGQFNRPHEVAVDAFDNVYVAEQQNNRIQVFDADGVFLTKWGSFGSGEGEFYYPMDIAIDQCGNIFVADQVNDRIQKFTLGSGNTDPTVSIISPASGALFAVGEPVNFAGNFTDDDGDVHTAQWACGDVALEGTVDENSGSVAATHAFESVGVYLIGLTVTDQCGASGTATTVGGLAAMVVVYDPSAGFVTGGGWIDSPPGAYAADPGLGGKANFGFVSKYKKGASTPVGETAFRFNMADLNFHSTDYDWLVIAGARAQYKGLGTINGGGNYGFMITAIDGELSAPGDTDRFRIKIVDKNQADVVIYDNQIGSGDLDDPATDLGGGSIVIHSSNGDGPEAVLDPKTGTEDALPSAPTLFQNYPNPFNPVTQIRFELPKSARVSLSIYDVSGRRLRHLVDGVMPAGQHRLEWHGEDDLGRAVSSGVYFCYIRAGDFVDAKRMVLLK